MSDAMAMEQAAGQAGQTAAVALQVLVMAAQALREQQQREAAAAPSPAAQQTAAPAPQPAPDPVRDRYAQMVRETVQPAAVAEAMVGARQWPQLAEELRKLEGAGIDVRQFLMDAAPVIERIDADLRAGSPMPGVTVSAAATNPRDPWAPPLEEKRDGPTLGERVKEWVKKVVEAFKETWKKVTGRGKPSALGDRSKDLAQHGISPQENTRFVVTAREALADETVLGQLVTSREWPSIAGQMKGLREAGHDPREALAGVPTRMRQAAAAGINLSPAEAARGLLAEQAKTPPRPQTVSTPAGATPSTAPTTARSPAPATSATADSSNTAAQHPKVRAFHDRAAAATAQSTTATPGATPAPGPQATPTVPAANPATPTRTHGR